MNKLTLLLFSVLVGTSLLVFGPLVSNLSVHAEQATDPIVKTPSNESPSAVAATPFTERPSNEAQQPAISLTDAVTSYIAELAKQPGFEAWRSAAWTSYPLGPGTHGWVVILKSGEKEIGYLVLHAGEQNRYRLTEYGNGSYPLFSMATLYRSLVQLELIDYPYHAERLYIGPLQAFWKVSVEDATRVWYIDAKTGEELPIHEVNGPGEFLKYSDLKAFTKTDVLHTIINTGEATPADPYEKLPWVQGDSKIDDRVESLLQSVANNKAPVYAAKLYGGGITIPLGVAGFHKWSEGDLFVRFAQDDDRYLPLNALLRSGHFYPS